MTANCILQTQMITAATTISCWSPSPATAHLLLPVAHCPLPVVASHHHPPPTDLWVMVMVLLLSLLLLLLSSYLPLLQWQDAKFCTSFVLFGLASCIMYFL